jgi:hypothetical protein
VRSFNNASRCFGGNASTAASISLNVLMSD